MMCKAHFWCCHNRICDFSYDYVKINAEYHTYEAEMTPLTDTKPSTVATMDAAYLLSLPRTERNRILAIAAESAAPLYEADLALPVAERDLTAFTALDGEPFYTK